jgi:hypothetical protein
VRYLDTEERDPARGRSNVARDHIEERRLTGPIGTQDRAPFAAFDRERNGFERPQSAEPPFDIGQTQCVRCRMRATLRRLGYGQGGGVFRSSLPRFT